MVHCDWFTIFSLILPIKRISFFDMPLNKPIEKRYFSITEVAKELGLNASQLRYWEKEFAVLKPRTNARGKRFYTESDREIIQQISWLVKDQGYTIDGARKAMKKRKNVALAMNEEAGHAESKAVDAAALLKRLQAVREKLMEWDQQLG